jgi:V8-like Glu-specific endopeptidase
LVDEELKMMNKSFQEKITRLLSQILQTDHDGCEALEATRSLEAATRIYDANQLVARLESLPDRLPPSDMTDPKSTKTAAETVTRFFQSGLEKARRGQLSSISLGELASFEAVVRADGSRPTLLLRDGQVPLDHPMIGDWRDVMTPLRDQIASAASAVCRVQPTGGSAGRYFGTGFLVDRDEGLVLTNQHVLEEVLSHSSTLSERSGRDYRIYQGVFVEFCGEADSPETKLFKVVEANPTPVEGESLARLDVALLKIETLPTSSLLPLALELDISSEKGDGSLISLCAIGFPGPPERAFGIHDGVDFGWVHHQLFGGRYGLKRIAPGKVHRAVSTLSDDPKKWVFGHDLTTLGGSSGSPTIAWLDGGRAFGIHFAGLTAESNLAHSAFAARDVLQTFLAERSSIV